MMHAIANPSFPVKMSPSPTNEVMAGDDFHITQTITSDSLVHYPGGTTPSQGVTQKKDYL